VVSVSRDREPSVGRGDLCAELSRLNAEPLSATASTIDHWLLVEYRGVWSRDVLAGSILSNALKKHLRAQLDALPNARLLFVRRPERRKHETHAVYFGHSLENDRRFYGLECERYDDLLSIDFAAALSREGGGAVPVEHPLIVVCTHGKRDRCCAKFGQPLYDELRGQAERDWVWQSTHVGGDRFAGNVVFLPEGLYFGRVERHDVWPLLDTYLGGEISLDHYRGRSCYPFPVQAAECEVRSATGLTGIDELTLLGSERRGNGTWEVAFAAEPTGEVHEVDVAAELGEPTHLTCGATSPQRPRRFAPTAHRVRARR
jgi:hypothetical protein